MRDVRRQQNWLAVATQLCHIAAIATRTRNSDGRRKSRQERPQPKLLGREAKGQNVDEKDRLLAVGATCGSTRFIRR